MRLFRRAASVALAATTVFGLTALPANATPPRVTVLGDSLTSQMCGHENQAIPTREVPAIDVGCWGWSGATSGALFRKTYEPGWIDPLNTNRPTNRFNVADAIRNADVVVIGLGTNNAIRQQPTDWFKWDIANFMALAGPHKPVYWLDLGVRTDVPNPIFNGSQFTSAVRHNDVLWSEARKYPNLRVVSWGGLTGPYPHYLISDGVHLSTDGVLARWRLVAAAIRS